MKLIYFLLFFPFFLKAQAGELDLVCVTEFPTTSFVIKEGPEKLNIRVIHHNGTKYMPIWEGIVVPNDIEQIQMAAETLQKLGNELDFEWNKKNCNKDEGLLSCTGGAVDFEVGGLKVHPWALDQYHKTTVMQWGTFQQYNMALNFSIGDKNFRISNDFDVKECRKPSQLSDNHMKLLKIK